MGKKGDVVIGISTSGNSKNVICGVEKAKILGAQTRSEHITIGHILCNIVELTLFG